MADNIRRYPFVSVIVPVYNDAKRLAVCLEALGEQTYPAERYEVIVVDNNSDESIEPLVADFGQVRGAHEKQPGSYAARNRGVTLAKGEVLAFTDADCQPAPDWIERGVEQLQTISGSAVVGGKIDFSFRQGRRPGVVEALDSALYLDQERYCKELGFAVTANLFTHRSVMEHIGNFRANVKSGEDKEWCQRAAAQGATISFAETARVCHPARATLQAYSKKVRRVAAGRYARKKDRGDSRSALLWDVAGSVKRRLQRGFAEIRASKLLDGVQKGKAVVALVYLEGIVQGIEGIRCCLSDRTPHR